jgi:hypothetical protein
MHTATSTTCPACAGGELDFVFRLERMPVTTDLLPSAAEARRVPRADVAIGVCTRCGMIASVRGPLDLPPPGDAVRAASRCEADGAAVTVPRPLLELTADPLPLLASLAARLDGDAVLRVEVADAAAEMDSLSMWDLASPRCAYFSATALHRLLQRAGLSAVRTAADGGVLRIDARLGDCRPPDGAGAADLIVAAHGMAERFARTRCEWDAVLAGRLTYHRRIAVWGAGPRTVTFLNAVEGGDRIVAVADPAPQHHGGCVPGTCQRVLPPAALRALDADTVLATDRAACDELAAHLRSLGLHAETLVV